MTDETITAAPPEKTLYIIDGFAQIFRAFYALLGGMTSPVTGEPTNACFGMAGMFIKLFRQFRPTYVVMAIDTPGKTFRDELYPLYKANRDAAPETLLPQIPRIIEMAQLFGIPVIGYEGAEADDVIATIVDRMNKDNDHEDVCIRIMSRDKDLEQLLNERVVMVDIHKDEIINADDLYRKKGVRPDQVVDLLTLTGDTSDNIPGVEGIGPKTAAKLLAEFNSIEGIYANIDKIKGKRRERLEAAKAHLPMSHQLVTLKNDLDMPFSMDDAKVGGIDVNALKLLFKELGFNRHLNDLDEIVRVQMPKEMKSDEKNDGLFGTLFDTGAAAQHDNEQAAPSSTLTHASDYDYDAVVTAEQLDELIQTLDAQKIIAVDTETIGLGHRSQLAGICFAWKTGHGVYVPVRSPETEIHLDVETVLEKLRPILESKEVLKCGHNIKYDLLVLRHAGIELRGIVFDTMIASDLLEQPGHGMDHLALSLLKHETIPIGQLIGPGGRGRKQLTMDKVPLSQITPYAAEDADITLRLYELFEPQLKQKNMDALANDVEMPLVRVLADMEYAGIRVDPKVLAQQQQALGDRIVDLRAAIHEATGVDFNIDSPRQLCEVLFERMKLPVIKRTKTGPSTDVEVLQKLAEMDTLTVEEQRVPQLVIEYRQLTKLVNTYLVNLRDSIEEDTGRVHASFHQTGAATGRLSSSGPNLQNIPIRTDLGRQIRKAFVAESGHKLVCADYSQIELRVLAHLSQDAALLEAFHSDQDIHAAVASNVFHVEHDKITAEQRNRAKVINFGIIYGVTPYGLARRIEGMDVKEAGKLIEEYKERFPGITTFLNRCVQQASSEGFVTTILGRRRNIPQIDSPNSQTRALGERLAINTVVQGSAADLIKLAMVNLHRRIEQENLSARLLLQIHDELVLEAPAEHAEEIAGIVRTEMEQAMKLDIPLKVEVGIGDNWLEAK